MSDSPKRFWRFRPFREIGLPSLLANLNNAQQISRYNNDPFDPHAIAAIRHSAYAKATVMRYVNILLDNGDQLFTQYTSESITQATNLYIHAENLLGKKPASKGKMPLPTPKSYADIKEGYAGESLPQFLIDLENAVDWHPDHDEQRYDSQPGNDIHAYFPVPENTEFMALWDRLEDRLYKIRHCMTIDGKYVPLSLFAPPIDPKLLASLPPESIAEVLSAITGGAVPYYRFSHLVSKAQALCGQLAGLSQSVLAALEKKDAESLNLLVNREEASLLSMQTALREQEIEDVCAQFAALQHSSQGAITRKNYYTTLLNNPISQKEQASLNAMLIALLISSRGNLTRVAASIAYAIPQAGSPFAMTYGGQQIGSMINAAASAWDTLAGVFTYRSQQQSILASYDRRAEEWRLQATLASYDNEQIAQQIISSEIREKIARRNLEVHQETMRQNKEKADFFKSKFTNEQLYQWMSGRLAQLQYQTYTLAYQVATMAQRAFQYEYNSDRNFLNFVPWSAAHQGMTAAESLMLSLSQMEVAVLDYSRPLEIEKTISLAAIDPAALLELRNTGECSFALSEALYDYDFPGHYNRKLKSVSVSIPSVTGPYQNIKATLTQTGNHVVLTSDASGLAAVDFLLGGGKNTPAASSLRTNWNNTQSIVLSRGHDDTGVLSADFGDGRYLPFEGTGAVSNWNLSMPKSSNLFSFDSIADVIITVQYTARDGGAVFRDKVRALAPLQTYGGTEYIDCHSMFFHQWQTFFASATEGPGTQTLSLPITTIAPPNVHDAQVHSLLVCLQAQSAAIGQGYLSLSLASGLSLGVEIGKENAGAYALNEQERKKATVDRICAQPVRLTFDLQKTPEALKTNGRLDPEKLNNIALILSYSGTTETSEKQNRKTSRHAAPTSHAGV